MHSNRVSQFYAFGEYDEDLSGELLRRFRDTMLEFIRDCGEDEEYPSKQILATITVAIDDLLESHVVASLVSEGWPSLIATSVGDVLADQTRMQAHEIVQDVINQDLN